jgi:hypothetical protein
MRKTIPSKRKISFPVLLEIAIAIELSESDPE